MKKASIIILALILGISLASCGDYSIEDVKTPSDVVIGNDTEDTRQDEQAEPSVATEITITETVIVDKAGVKITVKNLDANSLFGPELKLLIENNSGKDLTFQCRNASVNGYMTEIMMSVDVANGKKANDSLTFMESELEMCGISAIADMEFSFHIFDTEDWETYFDTDTIKLKTSIADTYEYAYDDTGDLAYDGNNVKVIIKGLAEDASFFGPSVVVYIENNSGKNITVQTRDVSINGFMIDSIFSCDVVAGKRAVSTITFMDSDLEENEITNIEDVEFSFHIYDSDDWETIVDTDVVNIAF